MGRRIRIYLLGVGLGSIMVYFSLIRGRDRDLGAWLPSPRVLKQIRQSDLTIGTQPDCFAKCALDSNFIKAVLKEGEVDFSKSDKDHIPPQFWVDCTLDGQEYTFIFNSTVENSVLEKIEGGTKDCSCPS